MDMKNRILDLLGEEARILDNRQYREWLELYTDDAIYWVPGWSDKENNNAISVIYDSRERLGERVFRLMDAPAYAQIPASKTVHVIGPVTNVQEVATGKHCASYAMSIGEIRPGDTLQVGLAEIHHYYANCEVTVSETDSNELRINRKVIRLLRREQPLYNLTFIL